MKKEDSMSMQEQLQLVKGLAEEGNAKAQHNLGAMYLKGQGVEQDWDQAILWFKKAAEQGDMLAQHNLGALFLQGAGELSPDPSEAVHWFTQAAMQGDPRSQHSLGALYFEGLGVDQDLNKSYIWLSLALQGAPEERQQAMRQVRDYVASQLSPEQIDRAQATTLEILKNMTVH
ncbi:MAG: sel1 repeat family protein [Magnetococcales bacterium]|nr:sel1 repeat family protein [Magnetococcales bacterium]